MPDQDSHRKGEAMYPLSFAQQRLWFLHRLEGPSATYNVPFVMRLSGPIDVPALEAAIHDIITRHETLRTLIVENDLGEARQQILPENEIWPRFTYIHADREDVDGELSKAVSYAFDLGHEIPIQTTVIEYGPSERLLVILFHHIAGDGVSAGPFGRDLVLAYSARTRGVEPGFPELPVQYRDYTLWHRELLGDEGNPESLSSRQLAYWREELAGVPQPIQLPFDRRRPAVASFEGTELEILIDPKVFARLETIAARQGATPSMVMQAAVAALLYHLGAGDDITIGSPIAGRTDEALADLIGFFVNTWVLRADLSGNPSFEALLSRVREKALSAYDNQDIPFDRLVDALGVDRSVSYQPLFQVMCAWQAPWPTLEIPGVESQFIPTSTDTSKFDLFFNFTPLETGEVHLRLEYASDLFDASSAHKIARRLVRVLESVSTDPTAPIGAIDLLTADERARLIGAESHASSTENGTIPELFDRQAARTPEASAVTHKGQSLTYAELREKVDALCCELGRRGAQPGEIIGLALPRSLDLIVTMLAILKSGAAYVPLDPTYPSSRLTAAIKQASPRFVITTAAVRTALPEEATEVVLSEDLAAGANCAPTDGAKNGATVDGVAYVMFTSGSTGQPKGVQVTHRGVCTGITGLVEVTDLNAGQQVLASTSINFDVSVFEIIGALASGASVDVVRDALVLTELERWDGDIITTVPSVFAEILRVATTRIDPTVIMLAGENLSRELADRIQTAFPDARLINSYGQTESFYLSAGTVSAADARSPQGVPIGKPLPGMHAYVLGSGLQPVAPGVTGELYVAGAIARGYHNASLLTAERFVADPFGPAGSRMYRTGDFARWTAAGQLECLGRVDSQVKIHGVRVEPGEIESVLESHPSVSRAAVIACDDRAGGKRLVGYVVPEWDRASVGSDGQGGMTDIALHESVSSRDLRQYLCARLPDYMVPSALVMIPRLPTAPNGKLDTDQLPEPNQQDTVFVAPTTDLETTLAQVFADVLGVERVGIHDDFFATGGDSIRSIQVVARARTTNVALSARDVFEHRTVRELALAIESRQEPEQVLPELEGGGTGPAPLTATARQIISSADHHGRFSMSILLEVPAGMERSDLQNSLETVAATHDILRSQLLDERTLLIRSTDTSDSTWDLQEVSSEDRLSREEIAAELDSAIGRLDPRGGRMAEAIWFRSTQGNDQLLLVLHHLVIDGVSWRILIPDLASAWNQSASGEDVRLPTVSTSYRAWSHAMDEHAHTTDAEDELAWWQGTLNTPASMMGMRPVDPDVDRQERRTAPAGRSDRPAAQYRRPVLPRDSRRRPACGTQHRDPATARTGRSDWVDSALPVGRTWPGQRPRTWCRPVAHHGLVHHDVPRHG
jgi:amino acid adenylation domain-containing protein